MVKVLVISSYLTVTVLDPSSAVIAVLPSFSSPPVQLRVQPVTVLVEPSS
jgi:hypothetical protein